MWLVTTFIAAVIATALWALVHGGRYRLGTLSLMLWGATVMILVDHLIGYEGGPFVTMHTGGLISSSIVLGLVMMVPVLIIWQSLLLYDRFKKKVTTE